MSVALAERLRLMTLTPTFVSLGAQTLGTYVGRHLHMSLQSCFAMCLNAEDKVELTSSALSHADSLSWQVLALIYSS